MAKSDPTWKRADASTLAAEAYAAKKATTTSRFRGVSWAKGAWMAVIKARGETKYLGRFDSEEQAAHAWDKVAFRYRGAQAKLNFHPRTGEELRGLKRLCDIEQGRLGDQRRRPKRSPRRKRHRGSRER